MQRLGTFRTIIVFSVFMVLLLVGSPIPSSSQTAIAGSYLYWFQCNGPTSKAAFGRAGLDGSSPNPLWVTGLYGWVAAGIAIDSDYLYWRNYNANTAGSTRSIGRVKLDGSEANPWWFSVSGHEVGAMAVDTEYLYYVDLYSDPDDPLGSYKCSIGRAKLDGSDYNTQFIKGVDDTGIYSIALDRNYIYFGDAGHRSIGRARLDGTNIEYEWIPGNAPSSIVITDKYIYWTEGNTIARANLDGSDPFRKWFVSKSGETLTGLATDNQYLYYADYNSIGRMDLDGSNPNNRFIVKPSSGVNWGIDGLAVTKNLPKVVSFVADPVAGAPPLKVSYTCDAVRNGGLIVKYKWDFNNDGVIDKTTLVNTIAHSYNQIGTYYAKVTVKDNTGHQAYSKPLKITVANGPELVGKCELYVFNDLAKKVSVNLRVVNNGDAPTGPFKVAFHLSDDGSTPLSPPFRTIRVADGLEAGASSLLKASKIFDRSIYGKYILIYIDSANQVVETEELNNGVRIVVQPMITQ